MPPPRKWCNNPDDVEHFLSYLTNVLKITAANYGVIIVQRGLDRVKYPGVDDATRSGTDRRGIGKGLPELLTEMKECRPDTVCVELEHFNICAASVAILESRHADRPTWRGFRARPLDAKTQPFNRTSMQ